MPRTTKIAVMVTRKISDDNYGAYGATITQEVELNEGESGKEVKAMMLKTLTKELDSHLASVESKYRTTKI